MKVTRVFYSDDLTAAKHSKLSEIAHVLAGVRTDVWNRFGSLAGVGKSHRDIRDEWMRTGHINDIPARLWKATLGDVIDDIGAYRAAAIEKVKKAVFKKYSDKEIRKGVCRALDNGEWGNNKYLRRMMRKYFKHGHTSVDNQIVLDSGCYTWFESNVSARRSASVVLVNAAYTSQTCSRCDSFGNRKGDAFYCTSCGVELHADQNAAKNVLSRLHDQQIGRWTNFKTVKSILIGRLRRSEETVPPGLELQPPQGYQPRANNLMTNFA